MSTTTIYRLGHDPCELGETRNAWRSAMQVWNYVAKRYCDMAEFPMMFAKHREEKQRAVWSAWQKPEMPIHDRIVLLCTLDGATVMGVDRDRVAEAFEQYASEHGSNASSASEQAKIIRAAELRPDDMIAWRQTSVAEFWGVRWDEDKDEAVWYDPKSGDKHWNVMSEAVKYPIAAAV